MPLNEGNAPVSISERRLHAVKHCGQGRRFSPRCTAITETDSRKVLRGNSGSRQGLWVSLRLSPDPYSSAFCVTLHTHSRCRQEQSVAGHRRDHNVTGSQARGHQPDCLSSLHDVPTSSSVQRRMGHVSTVLPSCQKHVRAPSVGDN